MRQPRCLSLSTCLAGAAILTGMAAAQPIEIRTDAYTLVGLDSGAVELRAPDGRMLISINGYRVEWAPPRTSGGTCREVTLASGQRALGVVYDVADNPTGRVAIRSVFEPLADRVIVRFLISAPDDLNVRGGMLARSFGPDAGPEQTHKMGRWTRHAGGGVPFEVPDGSLYRTDYPDASVFLSTDGVADWAGDWARHCPPERVATGQFEAELVLAPADLAARPSEIAARLNSRPVALDVWSDQPFHLWASDDKPLWLLVEATNVSDRPRRVERQCWARDFDGAVVDEGTDELFLDPGERRQAVLQFPAANRGILYVEVSLRSGDHEEFVRTTLGRLPPHEFQSGLKAPSASLPSSTCPRPTT